MDRIITISRQFGSRGKEIALEIGKQLGVPVYDREIIQSASEQSGIAPEHFDKSDEKRTSSFLFSLVTAHYGPTTSMEAPNVINDDSLFLHTSAALKRLATGGCIIVGRCADDVLKELKPLRLFICADMDSRIAAVRERFDLSEKEAASLIKKTDKSRASYYNYYTGKEWGNPINYDLTINTSSLSLPDAAAFVSRILG